jgi:hypothetical protein
LKLFLDEVLPSMPPAANLKKHGSSLGTLRCGPIINQCLLANNGGEIEQASGTLEADAMLCRNPVWVESVMPGEAWYAEAHPFQNGKARSEAG